MEALRKDSLVAPDLHTDFVDAQDNYRVCTFYECKPLHGLLVGQPKVAPPLRILTVHRL